jgi:hypothetical protein
MTEVGFLDCWSGLDVKLGPTGGLNPLIGSKPVARVNRGRLDHSDLKDYFPFRWRRIIAAPDSGAARLGAMRYAARTFRLRPSSSAKATPIKAAARNGSSSSPAVASRMPSG